MTRNKYHLHKEDRLPACDKAFFAGRIFILVAAVLLVMTFTMPVSSGISRGQILTRNLSSAAAMTVLGLFLKKWAQVYSSSNVPDRIMKSYKILTIIVSVVCVIKVALSIFFAMIYLLQENLIGIYYIGEATAWIALSAFFVSYCKRLVSDEDFNAEEFPRYSAEGDEDEEEDNEDE